MTASFGVSPLDVTDPNTADIADRIFKMADDVMYQAKETGRNRVKVSSRM
jgi:PleD family two-component response regulator